ncbi:AAA family ATPase [Agromyces arachidis]|uniref:AAA family ATPase n=1 Tax=Agromyces arachidis TaxID=766966 RepID=UPI00405772B3
MANWYVITGGPSSGKTTTVDLLRARGYRTTLEDARLYIDLQRLGGHSVAEVLGRRAEFQRAVLELQLAQEAALDPEELVFLDRAVPDSLAYYRFLGIEPDPALHDAIARAPYRKVFVMDLLPLAPDYARTEDAPAQHRIHELILEVYGSLPIPVERVPVLPPEDRVDHILARL